MSRPVVLVIAGSDSSGGAGLEADQKVLAALGCYAMTATTALTAQNTQGVRDIHVTPSAFVQKQIEACTDDVQIGVIKTGMLASEEIVYVVVDALTKDAAPISVVDPVMVSTSGSQLLPRSAVQTVRQKLLPRVTVLTPNIQEAKILLEEDSTYTWKEPNNVEDLIAVAGTLQRLGPRYVLLKGGHLALDKSGKIAGSPEEKDTVVDVLHGEKSHEIIRTPYINSTNTHGTGCSLASAVAANLAHGLPVEEAVERAHDYVAAAIVSAPGMGKGNGPINHFHSVYTLPFAPDRFLKYLLSRPDVQPVWYNYLNHEFVNRIADGSLAPDAFKFYMVQDYLYLIQFARAYSLAAYKANSLEYTVKAATNVLYIDHEMKLHREYCQEFGLGKADLDVAEESVTTTAYTRYLLDVGNAEDWFGLQVAFAPCLLGYGQIAARIYEHAETDKTETNKYLRWIKNYVSDDFKQAVRNGEAQLETFASQQSAIRIEQLIKIFIHATKMEIAFWDQGLAVHRSVNSKTQQP